MSKKTVVLLFLFIFIPLALYFFIPTDSTRIKKLIKKGAGAVEKEDIKGVMSCVSLSYRDEHGLSYLYVKENFKTFFQRYENIEVDYERLKITVNDKEAVAELDVWVIVTSGADTGYIIGDAADPVHVIFSLEKQRLKWQITKTAGLPVRYL